MRRTLALLVLAAATPAFAEPVRHGAWGQLALRLMLKNEAGELRPIANVAFDLTCSGPGSFPSLLCTDAEGRATALGRPGRCHLKSAAPLGQGGKRYTWEGNVQFYDGRETRLELSDDNAFVEDAPQVSPESLPSACGEPAILPTSSVELPEILVEAYPEYPPEARAKRIGGKVICQAEIGADGRVRSVTVLSSTDASFNASAVKAISSRRYIPARQDGRPIAVIFTIRIDFRLG